MGVPAAKSYAYANHSVGCMRAGSDNLRPSNRSAWASSRMAESKPPTAVGGTFAIRREPASLSWPSITFTLRPVTPKLSMYHQMSSLLSYRKRKTTSEYPPTSKFVTERTPKSNEGLSWWYSASTIGNDNPPSIEASMNPAEVPKKYQACQPW